MFVVVVLVFLGVQWCLYRSTSITTKSWGGRWFI